MTPGGALRRVLAVTGANRALVATRRLTAEPLTVSSAGRIVRTLGRVDPARRFALAGIEGPLERALGRMVTASEQDRLSPAGPSRRGEVGPGPASRSASLSPPTRDSQRRRPPPLTAGGATASGGSAVPGSLERADGGRPMAPPPAIMAEGARDLGGPTAGPATLPTAAEGPATGAWEGQPAPTPGFDHAWTPDVRGPHENPIGDRVGGHGEPPATPRDPVPGGPRTAMVSLAGTPEGTLPGPGPDDRLRMAHPQAAGSGELARLLSLWEVVPESAAVNPAATGAPGSSEGRAPVGPAPIGGPGGRTGPPAVRVPDDNRPQLEDVEDALDELLRREAERHGLEEGVA